MSNDVTALLLALARENAELREQLAAAQDMLMETAVDAGNLYERLEAVQIECDVWRAEAERLKAEAAPAFAFRRRRQGWR